MRSKAALAVLLASATSAHAFNDSSQFFTQRVAHAATFGASGEGVYFTGAPRFTSLGCATCHTDGPGAVRLKVGADPPDLFTAGYRPGTTYLLEIAISGETRGLIYGGADCTEPPASGDTFAYRPCNNNSFGMEIDAGDVPLTGAFCSAQPVGGACPAANPAAETLISPDDNAVFGNRAHDAVQTKLVKRNDATTWHVWWTAPQAGTGPLTVYVGAVDGNGGSGTEANDQDPEGDDVVQAAIPLDEANTLPTLGATAGCSVERRPAAAWWLLAPLLLALWVRRYRRTSL